MHMGQIDSAVLPKLGGVAPTDGEPAGGNEFSALRSIQEIDCLLASLVASWQISPQILQCRRSHRVHFCKPIALTPLDEAGQPCGETVVAMGRDISLGGISFQHRQPLPHCRIAITFQADSYPIESIVTRLSWCRFTRDSAYFSGGKFLRTIKLAENIPEDWDQLASA